MIRAALVAALGIAAPPPAVQTPARDVFEPQQAVMLAAEAAPMGVRGQFVMTVRATGRGDRGRLFLNSETDYRDQRNLSVRIEPNAVAALLDKAGASKDAELVGRRIAVSGIARRVRIDFVSASRRPSGKYYYQTHVPVTRVKQVTFLPPVTP